MRAIVVGFPKAGTTTLQEALTRSGLRCAHWVHGDKPVGQLVYDGWFERDDPFAYLRDLDVLTQMDICVPAWGANYWPNLDIALLLAIRRKHPDCLFILNARPPQQIADSIMRWPGLPQRLAGVAITGLPRGRGARPRDLRRWVAAHYAAMRQVFAGDPRFLDLDIASPEAPARLGAALGIEIAWWGRANANPPPEAA
ncbi:sulfotransferase [Falsiroseomonas sp. HW251]|uniref:sulfotransferase n=1 Tax=Falsiroseomonas sp. HW251 TaxID=3390998 RepID=UPI003D323CD4